MTGSPWQLQDNLRELGYVLQPLLCFLVGTSAQSRSFLSEHLPKQEVKEQTGSSHKSVTGKQVTSCSQAHAGPTGHQP